MPVKKTVAKKSVVKTTKTKKTPKPVKGEEKTFVRGGVVFEVSAVIPTQQYGNIQPKIQVVCNTVEEGRAMVMPMIEELYKTYAETPLSGKPLKFLGKVTESEKQIAPAPIVPIEDPKEVQATASSAVASTPSSSESSLATDRPAPFKKAEKMIGLSATIDALNAVEEQIKKSVKIDSEDKPALYEIVLKKREELNSK